MSLRHDRRRRLLADDADAPVDSPPIRLAGDDTGNSGAAAHAYADAAREARRRPLHTLLPLSRLAISLCIGACLVGVAATLGLHVAATSLAPRLGEEAVVGLRLETPGSIGRWLASTLLGLTAATALFIYSLRRHRLDDYHGRYRVWIVMALACTVLSLAESTRLVALVRALVRLGTDWGQVRLDIVWPSLIAVLGIGLGVRLAFELKRSVPALLSLVSAALCFAISTAVFWQWPIAVNQMSAPLWGRGTWLLGYVLVLTTFVVYGRQVQMHVAGASALPAKRKRKKPAEAPSEPSKPAAPRKPALKLRTDLDPVEVSEPTPSAAKAKETSPATLSTTASNNSGDSQKRLSRADRRRMARETRMAS